jgi:methionine--tRNA ligase beta chain
MSDAETSETVDFEHFAKVQLVVAEVKEAREHPNADRLLLLTIDTGDGERQIVAGIRGHYAPEDLPGRRIIVVKNLAPRKVRGEVSQGMLLAASTEESVVLLRPDTDVPPGTTVG